MVDVVLCGGCIRYLYGMGSGFYMGQDRRMSLYLPEFTIHLFITHHDAFVGASWTPGRSNLSGHCTQETEDVAMASWVISSYRYLGVNSCFYVR